MDNGQRPVTTDHHEHFVPTRANNFVLTVIQFWQNARNDVQCSDKCRKACYLNIACTHNEWYKEGSVFWLVQITLCFMPLHNFPTFIGTNVISGGPTFKGLSIHFNSPPRPTVEKMFEWKYWRTMTKKQQTMASYNTVQSFNFVGMNFHGWTTMNMFVNTWIHGFQIIYAILLLKVNKYFVGI